MPSHYQSNNAPVSIQKSEYSNLDLDSILVPFGGMKKYINRGERILLKVNLLNASSPEKAIVTHPAVIEAVAKEVSKFGGIPYVGDSPSGQFTKRRLDKAYRTAGLKKIERNLGIELNYDTRSKKITIPKGKRLKKIAISNYILKADKIIALPKIKTHSYMIITIATKIMYGGIPGLTKAKYHSLFIKRKSFAEMLLDVLSIIPPDLIIVDGIVGMQGDGPSGGMPVTLGTLLASENAVAIDLAVCKMLNIEPMGIPTLRQAKIKGLWPSKISYPILSPEEVKHNGFILPSTANYLITGKKQPLHNPQSLEKCTACGLCVEVCPKNAIDLATKSVKIDYKNCIKCYCCHEVCPENAIILKVTRKNS